MIDHLAIIEQLRQERDEAEAALVRLHNLYKQDMDEIDGGWDVPAWLRRPLDRFQQRQRKED